MNRLNRTLTLTSVVLFGLAYMTPIIVLGTFGILAEATHGVVAGAYLLALVAMLLTAYSYGVLAAEYPVAGSAYSYVRKTINSHVGFLVGWAVLLDYLFLPMVIWLFAAVYLKSAFPAIDMRVWILAFIGVTSTINIVGIKFANHVNHLMMLIQLLVLLAFVALSIHYIAGDNTKSLFSLAPFYQPHMQLSFVMSGAAIAAYSFLGFDAVTTLTEETINPSKVMPRAIMLITIVGGGIFVSAAYFVQLVHPGFVFESADSAAAEIAKRIGGDVFVSLFLIGLIIGQFASGLSAQASASRLLFAMGRDGVISRKIFGRLHGKFHSPATNIMLCGAIALLALCMDVTTSVSFINFGAFLAFTSVNLAVIAKFYFPKRQRSFYDFLLYFAIPLSGAISDLWLLSSLDRKALILGLIWLATGVVYLSYLTKGFSKEPPEMSFPETS